VDIPGQCKADACLNIMWKFRKDRHIQTGVTRRRISNTMQLAGRSLNQHFRK